LRAGSEGRDWGKSRDTCRDCNSEGFFTKMNNDNTTSGSNTQPFSWAQQFLNPNEIKRTLWTAAR
jgi:hypothetical protein